MRLQQRSASADCLSFQKKSTPCLNAWTHLSLGDFVYHVHKRGRLVEKTLFTGCLVSLIIYRQLPLNAAVNIWIDRYKLRERARACESNDVMCTDYVYCNSSLLNLNCTSGV